MGDSHREAEEQRPHHCEDHERAHREIGLVGVPDAGGDEEKEEERWKNDAANEVAGVAGEAEETGFVLGENEFHLYPFFGSPVRAAKASSRLTDRTSKLLKATFFHTNWRTAASESGV